MTNRGILQNLHTHTTYCDGVDTPEQMILSAMEKGFDSIGFSGHSYMFYSNYVQMTPEKTEKYKAEIAFLKEKYREKIDVFCGLEYDMYSAIDQSGYDYLIGSVHYLKIGNGYVGFDRSSDEVRRVINTYFDGNGMAYAQAYYQALAELPSYGKFDIVGHFDLICKHSDRVKFFDEDSSEYKNAVLEAADALRGRISFFEVNTGAIARGYRTAPYPTVFIIKELQRMGFGACITSDCHNAKHLDCGFNEATAILKACGFREKFILTERGFLGVPL